VQPILKTTLFSNQAINQRLLWAGIVLFYFVLRIHPIGIPLDRDEGVFGLVGRTILEGGLPYLHGIDQKPPLIFYLYALILSIFPSTALGIHVFLHLYNFITLVILFLFSKRAMDTATAFWIVFIFALISINPYVQGYTASIEMFALLPLMLSIWWALLATESDSHQSLYLVLSGIFGALACWFKPPFVFSAAFALIIIVHKAFIHNNTGERLQIVAKAVTFWLAGGIGVSICIVGYFAYKGVFEEFYYWSFRHGMLYSAMIPVGDKLLLSWQGLSQLLQNAPIIFILALACPFLKPTKSKLSIYLIVGFFLLSLVGVSFGFAYKHYYAQLLLPLAILAGIAISTVAGKIVDSRKQTGASIVIVIAVFVVQILPNFDYHFSQAQLKINRKFYGINPFFESVSIARYLNERTTPEDEIFIFGSEPQILLLAERRSATAFYMIYPLMNSIYPRYLEFQQRVIEEVENSKPEYIVSVVLPASFLYDGKAEQSTSIFLQKYLKQNYQLEDRLLFSDAAQSWISVKQGNIRRDQVRPNVAIMLFRRAKS